MIVDEIGYSKFISEGSQGVHPLGDVDTKNTLELLSYLCKNKVSLREFSEPIVNFNRVVLYIIASFIERKQNKLNLYLYFTNMNYEVNLDEDDVKYIKEYLNTIKYELVDKGIKEEHIDDKDLSYCLNFFLDK